MHRGKSSAYAEMEQKQQHDTKLWDLTELSIRKITD